MGEVLRKDPEKDLGSNGKQKNCERIHELQTESNLILTFHCQSKVCIVRSQSQSKLCSTCKHPVWFVCSLCG